MEMSAITSPPQKMPLSFWRRLDIPFAVMGLFFVAMAVLEYLFPATGGKGRLAIKILCGVQIAFALLPDGYPAFFYCRCQYSPGFV
jgi:hypothetical protein